MHGKLEKGAAKVMREHLKDTVPEEYSQTGLIALMDMILRRGIVAHMKGTFNGESHEDMLKGVDKDFDIWEKLSEGGTKRLRVNEAMLKEIDGDFHKWVRASGGKK
jgi:macrodomain Ter protein organizer (MatP/YcbG family)